MGGGGKNPRNEEMRSLMPDMRGHRVGGANGNMRGSEDGVEF